MKRKEIYHRLEFFSGEQDVKSFPAVCHFQPLPCYTLNKSDLMSLACDLLSSVVEQAVFFVGGDLMAGRGCINLSGDVTNLTPFQKLRNSD